MAQELSDRDGTRIGPNLIGRSNPQDAPALHHHETVGEAESLVVIMGHMNRGGARFRQDLRQLVGQAVTQTPIERTEWLVKQ